MHVKVGTLDELPFHRIDFQASDEHENGSDCDSLDDDEDDDGAKENGYQCLKSTISHNGIKSSPKFVEFICKSQFLIFPYFKTSYSFWEYFVFQFLKCRNMPTEHYTNLVFLS